MSGRVGDRRGVRAHWNGCASLLEGPGLSLDIEGQEGSVQDAVGQLKLLWLLNLKK